MRTQFRELKARKAKYGFDGGCLSLGNVVEFGKFVGELRNFNSEQYIIEEVGYNNPEVRIYTDNEEIANWLRNYTF